MGTSPAGKPKKLIELKFSSLASFCSTSRRSGIPGRLTEVKKKAIMRPYTLATLIALSFASDRLLRTLSRAKKNRRKEAGYSEQSRPRLSQISPQSANPWNRQGGSLVRPAEKRSSLKVIGGNPFVGKAALMP